MRLTGAALLDALAGVMPRLVRDTFAAWPGDVPGFAEWRGLVQLAGADATQRAILEERGAALGALVGAPLPSAAGQEAAIFVVHTALSRVARAVAARLGSELDVGIFGWIGGDAELDGVIARFTGVSDTADDLFRPLYEATMPARVRHSLGEFYTPAWLADIVVERGLRFVRGDWRGLDPCCGSGVFLLAMIRRMLAEGARLDQVLRRAHGLDLNPIAVVCAKVSYLAAVVHLADGPVDIPVRLGDATRPTGERFDLVVGNPPWVDWKRLPAAYRARVKASGVARHLFSGDGIVGGISLNVCALIASAAAEGWRTPGGVVGFLMPRMLLFQQSYAGFRGSLGILALDDWSAAGRPFAPVTDPFLTWYLGETDTTEAPYTTWRTGPAGLVATEGRVGCAGSAWVVGDDLSRFETVAGECAYTGREGIEFYPQELWLFSHVGDGRFRNFQGTKSRYRVAECEIALEQEFLRPLVKGTDIGRFSLSPSGWYVPFPYADGARVPLPMAELRVCAPRLAAWLETNREVLDAQPVYNQRIIGRGEVEPHALARVGAYSYAPHRVAFRDNTRWGAVVVSDIDTPWGPVRPCFQNHAVTIAERPGGGFLTEEEAHYLCAALNAPIVERFLRASSDSRSFRIRPPVRVPLFRPEDPEHRALAMLSRRAHAGEAVEGELDVGFMRVLAATPAPGERAR